LADVAFTASAEESAEKLEVAVEEDEPEAGKDATLEDDEEDEDAPGEEDDEIQYE
jgi:histone acetyltransferase SAS3